MSIASGVAKDVDKFKDHNNFICWGVVKSPNLHTW